MATQVQNNPEMSTSALVGGIINDAQELFKEQLELFKAELKQDMEKAREGSVVFVAGAGLAFVGLIVLAFALAHLLNWAAPALPLWGAFAIIGGVISAAGAALLAGVYIRLKKAKPLSVTATALEENVEWKTNPK